MDLSQQNCNLKTDLSQKSATLQRTFHKNLGAKNELFTEIGGLQTDPSIKKCSVIFHTRSVVNEFSRKLLKKSLNYIFHKKEKLFHKFENIYQKNIFPTKL